MVKYYSFSMDPPPKDAIKINVHGTSPVNPLANGNRNAIGILARDYVGAYVHGIMGPIHGANEIQAHLWEIHIAMKWAFDKQILKVIY